VAEIIAITQCTYTWRDGQAEWAWVAWINKYPAKGVTNPSTNQAQRSSTLSMHKAVNLAASTYLFVACFSCKTQQ